MDAVTSREDSAIINFVDKLLVGVWAVNPEGKDSPDRHSGLRPQECQEGMWCGSFRSPCIPTFRERGNHELFRKRFFAFDYFRRRLGKDF